MEKAFSHGSRFPSPNERIDLEAKTGLSKEKIAVWFQNRRAKEKKQEKLQHGPCSKARRTHDDDMGIEDDMHESFGSEEMAEDENESYDNRYHYDGMTMFDSNIHTTTSSLGKPQSLCDNRIITTLNDFTNDPNCAVVTNEAYPRSNENDCTTTVYCELKQPSYSTDDQHIDKTDTPAENFSDTGLHPLDVNMKMDKENTTSLPYNLPNVSELDNSNGNHNNSPHVDDGVITSCTDVRTHTYSEREISSTGAVVKHSTVETSVHSCSSSETKTTSRSQGKLPYPFANIHKKVQTEFGPLVMERKFKTINDISKVHSGAHQITESTPCDSKEPEKKQTQMIQASNAVNDIEGNKITFETVDDTFKTLESSTVPCAPPIEKNPDTSSSTEGGVTPHKKNEKESDANKNLLPVLPLDDKKPLQQNKKPGFLVLSLQGGTISVEPANKLSGATLNTHNAKIKDAPRQLPDIASFLNGSIPPVIHKVGVTIADESLNGSEKQLPKEDKTKKIASKFVSPDSTKKVEKKSAENVELSSKTNINKQIIPVIKILPTGEAIAMDLAALCRASSKQSSSTPSKLPQVENIGKVTLNKEARLCAAAPLGDKGKQVKTSNTFLENGKAVKDGAVEKPQKHEGSIDDFHCPKKKQKMDEEMSKKKSENFE